MIQHKYSGNEFQTVVTSTKGKQMLFFIPVSRFEQGVKDYKAGAMVQDAFPFLSPNEREFLISGLLPSEFDDLFEDLPDEDCDEPPPPFGEP